MVELAIATSLDALANTYIEKNISGTAAINTNSKISLNSFNNVNNYSYIIEDIWENLSKLEISKWAVRFVWLSPVQCIL